MQENQNQKSNSYPNAADYRRNKPLLGFICTDVQIYARKAVPPLPIQGTLRYHLERVPIIRRWSSLNAVCIKELKCANGIFGNFEVFSFRFLIPVFLMRNFWQEQAPALQNVFCE